MRAGDQSSPSSSVIPTDSVLSEGRRCNINLEPNFCPYPASFQEKIRVKDGITSRDKNNPITSTAASLYCTRGKSPGHCMVASRETATGLGRRHIPWTTYSTEGLGGHGGALVESTPFVRRVMGSTPALAASE